jgi:hypothetical protein
MKKIYFLVLIALILALAACGSGPVVEVTRVVTEEVEVTREVTPTSTIPPTVDSFLATADTKIELTRNSEFSTADAATREIDWATSQSEWEATNTAGVILTLDAQTPIPVGTTPAECANIPVPQNHQGYIITNAAASLFYFPDISSEIAVDYIKVDKCFKAKYKSLTGAYFAVEHEGEYLWIAASRVTAVDESIMDDILIYQGDDGWFLSAYGDNPLVTGTPPPPDHIDSLALDSQNIRWKEAEGGCNNWIGQNVISAPADFFLGKNLRATFRDQREVFTHLDGSADKDLLYVDFLFTELGTMPGDFKLFINNEEAFIITTSFTNPEDDEYHNCKPD